MHRVIMICIDPAEQARASIFPDGAEGVVHIRRDLSWLRAALPKAPRCLTSPLPGARLTAEALGLPAQEEPALRDLDLGRWKGRALAGIAADEPEAVAEWLTDPRCATHGGESRAALQTRVSRWLDSQATCRGRTLCLTHPAVIRTAALHALEAPPAAFFRLDIEPLTRTDLSHDGRRWALRTLNAPIGPGGGRGAGSSAP